MKKLKVGFLAQWPIHYHLPIYRGISVTDELDFSVIYCDDLTLRGYFEDEMNSVRKWDDIDMLHGYKSDFLRNYIRHNNNRQSLTLLNPGVFKKIFTEKFDVLIIGGYVGITYWFALLACKIMRTKTIFRGESTLHVHRPKNLGYYLKFAYLKLFFKFIDMELFSCSGNKEFLDFYSGNNPQISVPCAVDNDYYQEQFIEYYNQRHSLRNDLGISFDETVITTVGKLVDRKKPLDIIEAVANSEIYKPVVLFVGDGALRIAVEMEAQKYGVKVIFTGYQATASIAKYYSISDIYFQISFYDPSPKSLNEAMNFRLPILVTSVIGTSKDLVVDGENGFVVEVGNKVQMTSALNRMIDPAVRSNMGDTSLRIVNDNSIDLDVSQIIKAVSRITN